MKKAMMKNLIFCLLVLTGAGMLNSCQQDEVVSEAPASKGVIIRASLPNDAQSRVMLGDTEGNKTKVYWETGDVIKVKIGEIEYTFTTTTESEKTTAKFTCAVLDKSTTLTPGTTYTFTYSQQPTAGNAQAGTIAGLKQYHYMTATYTAKEGDSWDNVNLIFSTQVALVKFTSLPSNSKVWLYNDNTCLAYTNTSVNGEVYFAIPQGSYGEGRVYVETTSDHKLYITDLQGSGNLTMGNLYCLDLAGKLGNGGITGELFANNSENTNVYYYKSDNTIYLLGSGIIQERKSMLNSPKYIIILDGITSVGNKAFHMFEGLTNVIIPASVTSIGENAFQQCGGFNCLTILNNIPPDLDSKAFYQNGDPVNIKVPSGSVGTYQSATGWSAYADKIQAIQ